MDVPNSGETVGVVSDAPKVELVNFVNFSSLVENRTTMFYTVRVVKEIR